MLNNISRAQLVGGWIAAVIVTMACSVVAGANLTVSAGELWLAACLGPPAIILLLWHRAPPATVSELLYSASAQPKDGRS